MRVLERREEWFRPSRALIVHPRTLEVLRPLGVTGALLARGDPAPSVQLHLRGREVRAELAHFPMADTAFPIFSSRPSWSRRYVRGAGRSGRGSRAACRWWTSIGKPAGRGPRCGGRAGRSLSACRYVAGCDGPASLVRRAAEVGWRGGTYRQEVVLADVELDADFGARRRPCGRGARRVLFLSPLGGAGHLETALHSGWPRLRRLRRSARRTRSRSRTSSLHAPRGPAGPRRRTSAGGWPGCSSTTDSPPRTAPGRCFWSATPPTCTHPPAARA